MNLSKLPSHVIEAIDQSPKLGKVVVAATLSGVKITTGNALCEAGLLQQVGISSVICGLGSIDQAHKPNEFIS
jgi:acetylornithine deacetylase